MFWCIPAHDWFDKQLFDFLFQLWINAIKIYFPFLISFGKKPFHKHQIFLFFSSSIICWILCLSSEFSSKTLLSESWETIEPIFILQMQNFLINMNSKKDFGQNVLFDEKYQNGKQKILPPNILWACILNQEHWLVNRILKAHSETSVHNILQNWYFSY